LAGCQAGRLAGWTVGCLPAWLASRLHGFSVAGWLLRGGPAPWPGQREGPGSGELRGRRLGWLRGSLPWGAVKEGRELWWEASEPRGGRQGPPGASLETVGGWGRGIPASCRPLGRALMTYLTHVQSRCPATAASSLAGTLRGLTDCRRGARLYRFRRDTPPGGVEPLNLFGRSVLVASQFWSRLTQSHAFRRRVVRPGVRRAPSFGPSMTTGAGGVLLTNGNGLRGVPCPPPLVFVLSQGRRPVRLRSSRWARPPGSPSATRGSAVVKCGLGRDLMSRPILRIFSRRLSPLWVGGTAVYRTVSKRGPKTSYSTVKPKGNLRKTLPRTNSEGLRLVSPCPVSRSHSVKEDVTR